MKGEKVMDETMNVVGEVAQVTEEAMQGTGEGAKVRKKRPTPAEQDQQMADEIAEARVLIETVKGDPEILAALAVFGTDNDEIAIGEGLQVAAQTRFTERQAALAFEHGQSEAASKALREERGHYADFREVCRVRVTDPTVQQALSLRGLIPQDRQKWMTQARAAYGEAAKPTHQTLLSRIGFGTETLTTRLAALDTLDTTLAAARGAAGDARTATIARNDAFKALQQWVSALKRIARRALRNRPGLAAKLKL